MFATAPPCGAVYVTLFGVKRTGGVVGQLYGQNGFELSEVLSYLPSSGTRLYT